MLQAYGSAWITVSVDHVAALTKERPLSVVPIIVDYYTGSVNRPVKTQGSHGQGLLITLAPPAQRVSHLEPFSVLYERTICL